MKTNTHTGDMSSVSFSCNPIAVSTIFKEQNKNEDNQNKDGSCISGSAVAEYYRYTLDLMQIQNDAEKTENESNGSEKLKQKDLDELKLELSFRLTSHENITNYWKLKDGF